MSADGFIADATEIALAAYDDAYTAEYTATGATDNKTAAMKAAVEAVVQMCWTEKEYPILSCGHHQSLEIRSSESDYRACELCEARAQQRDAETMESKYHNERDEAYALLRKMRDECLVWPAYEPLRAAVDKLLGNA